MHYYYKMKQIIFHTFTTIIIWNHCVKNILVLKVYDYRNNTLYHFEWQWTAVPFYTFCITLLVEKLFLIPDACRISYSWSISPPEKKGNECKVYVQN